MGKIEATQTKFLNSLAKAAAQCGMQLRVTEVPLNEVPEYFRPLMTGPQPPEVMEHLQALAPIHKNLIERRKELEERERLLAEKIARLNAPIGTATADSKAGELVSVKVGDPVNHPAHYNAGKIEVIEFIEDQKFGYNIGNAVKYLARYGKKKTEKAAEDLAKARWYILREMELLHARQGGKAPARPNEMTARLG